MPHMDGIEATSRIRAELHDVRVLGLSMQPRSTAAVAIEQAGAAGFFVNGTDTERLIEHLLAVHALRGVGHSETHHAAYVAISRKPVAMSVSRPTSAFSQSRSSASRPLNSWLATMSSGPYSTRSSRPVWTL